MPDKGEELYKALSANPKYKNIGRDYESFRKFFSEEANAEKLFTKLKQDPKYKNIGEDVESFTTHFGLKKKASGDAAGNTSAGSGERSVTSPEGKHRTDAALQPGVLPVFMDGKPLAPTVLAPEKQDEFIAEAKNERAAADAEKADAALTAGLGLTVKTKGLGDSLTNSGGLTQDIFNNLTDKPSALEAQQSASVAAALDAYAGAQGKDASNEILNHSQDAFNNPREIGGESKGDFRGHMYNEGLRGLGSIGAALTDIALAAGKNLPTGDPYVESGEIQKDFREEGAGNVRNFLKDQIGVEVDAAKEKKYRDGFFTGALGGLANSVPAMLAAGATMGGTLYLQAYDGAMESISAQPNAELLDEDSKTIYAATVGAVVSRLEKLGLDRIIKGSGVLNFMVTKIINAARKSGGKVTGEVLEELIDKYVGGLANRFSKIGVRAIDAFMTEASTGGMQEVATIGAENLMNEATGESIFDTSDANTWKGFIGRVSRAAGQEGVGGFVMGGALGVLNPGRRKNLKNDQLSLEAVNTELNNPKLLPPSQEILTQRKVELQTKIEKQEAAEAEEQQQLSDKAKKQAAELSGDLEKLETALADPELGEEMKPVIAEKIEKLEEKLEEVIKEGKVAAVSFQKSAVSFQKNDIVQYTGPDGQVQEVPVEEMKGDKVVIGVNKEGVYEKVEVDAKEVSVISDQVSASEPVADAPKVKVAEAPKEEVKLKYGGKDKDLKGEPQKQWMKPVETSEQATNRLAGFVEASDYKGREQSAFIDRKGESTEVKLRNDNGKWNWYEPKSKKPIVSFDTAKDAIKYVQAQPFWDNGELNKNGRDDNYFKKGRAEFIQREIDNGNVLEDVTDGKISAQEAIAIIESAGLEVPKELLNAKPKPDSSVADSGAENATKTEPFVSKEKSDIIDVTNDKPEKLPTKLEETYKTPLEMAEFDLTALKKTENKAKKYEASIKRLIEAKKAKQISPSEFDEAKARFDDVLAKANVKAPKLEPVQENEVFTETEQEPIREQKKEEPVAELEVTKYPKVKSDAKLDEFKPVFSKVANPVNSEGDYNHFSKDDQFAIQIDESKNPKPSDIKVLRKDSDGSVRVLNAIEVLNAEGAEKLKGQAQILSGKSSDDISLIDFNTVLKSIQELFGKTPVEEKKVAEAPKEEAKSEARNIDDALAKMTDAEKKKSTVVVNKNPAWIGHPIIYHKGGNFYEGKTQVKRETIKGRGAGEITKQEFDEAKAKLLASLEHPDRLFNIESSEHYGDHVVEGDYVISPKKISKKEAQQAVDIQDKVAGKMREKASNEAKAEVSNQNTGWKKMKALLGEKKAKAYFDKVRELFNLDTDNVVDYRANGIVTQEGDKYTFHAFGDTDLKKWRIAFTKDISDQYNGGKKAAKNQIVDKKGNPLTVYHASANPDIKEFKTRGKIETAGGMVENYGAYFGPTKGEYKHKGDVEYEANIDIKNPYVTTDQLYSAVITKEKYDDLKSKGHDGVILMRDGKAAEYIVLDPAQAKVIKQTKADAPKVKLAKLPKPEVKAAAPTSVVHEKPEMEYPVHKVTIDGKDFFLQRMDEMNSGSSWYEVANKDGKGWYHAHEPREAGMTVPPLGWNKKEAIDYLVEKYGKDGSGKVEDGKTEIEATGKALEEVALTDKTAVADAASQVFPDAGYHAGTLAEKSDTLRSGYRGDMPFTGYYFVSEAGKVVDGSSRARAKDGKGKFKIVDFSKYRLLKPGTNGYWHLKAGLKRFEDDLLRGGSFKEALDRLESKLPFIVKNELYNQESKIEAAWKKWHADLTADGWKESERFETVFLKELGFEGVDVRGTKEQGGDASPDSFSEGSIIFDLKPGTVTTLAEAYHQAKTDGKNPGLVKAVEKMLAAKEGGAVKAGAEIQTSVIEKLDKGEILVNLREDYRIQSVGDEYRISSPQGNFKTIKTDAQGVNDFLDKGKDAPKTTAAPAEKAVLPAPAESAIKESDTEAVVNPVKDTASKEEPVISYKDKLKLEEDVKKKAKELAHKDDATNAILKAQKKDMLGQLEEVENAMWGKIDPEKKASLRKMYMDGSHNPFDQDSLQRVRDLGYEVSDKGQVTFDVKDDGTFKVHYEMIPVAYAEVKKGFPEKTQRPPTITPLKRESVSDQNRAIGRGSLEANKQRLDNAKENLATALKSNNKKLQEVFQKELEKEQAIFSWAEGIDFERINKENAINNNKALSELFKKSASAMKAYGFEKEQVFDAYKFFGKEISVDPDEAVLMVRAQGLVVKGQSVDSRIKVAEEVIKAADVTLNSFQRKDGKGRKALNSRADQGAFYGAETQKRDAQSDIHFYKKNGKTINELINSIPQQRPLAEIVADQQKMMELYHAALKEANLYDQAKDGVAPEFAIKRVKEQVEKEFGKTIAELKAEKDAVVSDADQASTQEKINKQSPEQDAKIVTKGLLNPLSDIMAGINQFQAKYIAANTRKAEDWLAAEMSLWGQSKNYAKRNISQLATSIFNGIPRTQENLKGKLLLSGGFNKARFDGSKLIKQLYDLVGYDLAKIEHAHELLDPELYASLGVSPNTRIGTVPRDVQLLHDELRDLLDNIHRRNFALGFISLDTYNKFKGKYVPRMYETNEIPEDVQKLLDEQEKYNPVTKLDLGQFKKRKELDDLSQQALDDVLKDPVYATVKRLMQLDQNAAIAGYVNQIMTETPHLVITPKKVEGRKTEGKKAKEGPIENLNTDVVRLDANGKEIKKEPTELELIPPPETGLSVLPKVEKDPFIPPGYQLMSGKGYGKLDGKYVPNYIAEDFKGFFMLNHTMNLAYDFTKGYDRLGFRQFLKKSYTVFNPIVQLGNFMCNFTFGFSSGIDPVTFASGMPEAYRHIKGESNDFQDLIRHGLIGNDIVTTDLMPLKAQQGLTPKKQNMTVKAWNSFDEATTRLYGMSDDIAKMNAYLIFKKQGFSQQDAIQKVYEGFQNYATVGKMWDMVSKTPVFGNPFIKFQADLFRIMKNGATKTPLTTAMYLSTLYMMPDIMKLIGLSNDDEDELEEELRTSRSFIPKVPLGFMDIPLVYKTKFGEVNLARYLSPFYLFDTGGEQGTNNLLKKFLPFTLVEKQEAGKGNVSTQVHFADPVAGTALSALFFDTDFRGKSIKDPEATRYRASGATDAEQIQNKITYLGRSWIPQGAQMHDFYLTQKYGEDFYNRTRSLGQSILNMVVKVQAWDDSDYKKEAVKRLDYNMARMKSLGDERKNIGANLSAKLENAITDLAEKKITQEQYDKRVELFEKEGVRRLADNQQQQEKLFENINEFIGKYKRFLK